MFLRFGKKGQIFLQDWGRVGAGSSKWIMSIYIGSAPSRMAIFVIAAIQLQLFGFMEAHLPLVDLGRLRSMEMR